jgi:hypothetical protein
MKINGIDYENKELDFTNILCDLEDIGIDIMSMGSDNIKPFTLCRGIVSVYTGEKELTKCGKILSEHLQNGGTLDELINPFMEAMEKAGFGKKVEEEKSQPSKKTPKKTEKVSEEQAE